MDNEFNDEELADTFFNHFCDWCLINLEVMRAFTEVKYGKKITTEEYVSMYGLQREIEDRKNKSHLNNRRLVNLDPDYKTWDPISGHFNPEAYLIEVYNKELDAWQLSTFKVEGMRQEPKIIIENLVKE